MEYSDQWSLVSPSHPPRHCQTNTGIRLLDYLTDNLQTNPKNHHIQNIPPYYDYYHVDCRRPRFGILVLPRSNLGDF